MKSFIFLSTLVFVIISVLIDLVMSANAGYTVFAANSWLINVDLFSLQNWTSWFMQGLSMSTLAWLYMDATEPISSGTRFGLITGLLFMLIYLVHLMFNLDAVPANFMSDSLLTMSLFEVGKFSLMGFLFGLFAENNLAIRPDFKDDWSLL